MMDKQRRLASREVFEFNQDHPVGTPVRYWPDVREGEGVISRTCAIALSVSGTGVFWVEGHCGCVALSHVEVLTSMAEGGAR